MLTHRPRNRLCDPAHQPRVLQFPDRCIPLRLDGGGDVLKLVVSVKLDTPTKGCELVGKTGVDKMDGAFVDANFWL